MEQNVTYASVRCTYTELRDANGGLIYSLSHKDCTQPAFAIENYKALTEGEQKAVRALMKLKSGKISMREFLAGNYGEWAGDDTYTELSFRNKETGSTMSGSTLMKKATAKVYLTADGFDAIAKLSGAKRAYEVAGMDAYVLTPSIIAHAAAQVTVTEDPEVPEIAKKNDKKSKLTKILLALAGWALFK